MPKGLGVMFVGISMQLLALTFAIIAQGAVATPHPAFVLALAGLILVGGGALWGYVAQEARPSPESESLNEGRGR